ncbi:Coiled-coil domain-containing protein 146 [Oryzias melastigma]|uniref:Coiled-coil domain-containing protein 146 n=1 Tax=Oryzias melastigma TaxID=30732 RepID=A0A834BWF1_ORYME|nr:Coiled-coil domain-containing protein 146 [Oryzias melastigma]
MVLYGTATSLVVGKMFTEGKINQATVSKLKASYKLLHDKWKRSQESEIKLLSEAKRCRAELERLQVEVESAEEQSNVEEPDSEVSALRGQLLGAYNTLHAAEEREHKTQHELQCRFRRRVSDKGLSEASDRTLESVNRAADFKELKSKVPSSVELLKKVEQLEGNLAERERQLLEKELLVEQVTRLTKPLGEQAENYRQDSLSLAKRLNEVRTLLIDTNQRIMAVSAELSVKQADALWEKQQIKEKEVQMERCQRRLEQGLSPHPEIEEEWRRTLRDKRRRQKDKEEKERLAEEDKWKPLPSGKRTTADIRPNAYIPENDLLPLPKPYGAMAPFKPSQPGANMRHFAKL